MLRIGLTGGIGSGKTTVARIFELLGAPVYYADVEAKRIMNEDEVLKREIQKHFGEEAYNARELNRDFLASKVFTDKNKLDLLNSLVHPVTLRDADGRAIDEAQISIDGGMPQHGHGLPTRPRVTRNLGDGIYEIEGVRFNMGGWWEFKLAIAGSRGADTVTLFVGAATNFVSFRDVSGDPHARVAAVMTKAAGRAFDAIKGDHIAAHQALFRRAAITFESTPDSYLPTDQRLKKFNGTNDPSLAELRTDAIKGTGAYGASMASNYNSRPLAAEVLLDQGRYAVVRRRQTLEEMVAGEQAAHDWDAT